MRAHRSAIAPGSEIRLHEGEREAVTALFTVPTGDNQRSTWVPQGDCWSPAPDSLTGAVPGDGALITSSSYESQYYVVPLK